MNWLLNLFRPNARAIQCPRCQSQGAEHRGPIVLLYDNGARKKVGDMCGCPHCGLAFFTQDGGVYLFAHRKSSMNLHPMTVTPDRLQQREETPSRDTDIRWR